MTQLNTIFVNPYSFVPLPDHIQRSEPSWHDRLGEGRLAGRICFTLTARSPLSTEQVQGGDRQGSEENPPDRIFGSSLSGALRSVHEVLAGGCLRVFDEEYRPGSYRQPADPNVPKGFRLARVEATPHNGLRAFRLCDGGEGFEDHSQAWITDQAAGGVVDSDLHDMIVSEDKLVAQGTKRVITKATLTPRDRVGSPGAEGAWVVHVVDKQPPGRRDGPPKFAAGRLTDRLVTARDVQEQDRLDDQYGRAAADSSDVQDGRQWNDPVPAFVGIPGGKTSRQLDAKRRPVPAELTPGQLVWVKLTKAGDVEDVKVSLIWRRAVPDSVATAGERVSPANLACGRHADTHDEHHAECPSCRRYCPTCRIFGLVEPVAGTAAGNEVSRDAVQGSYRGHLQVHDLYPQDPSVRPEATDIAPLGQPRPGSGQMYLEPPQDLSGAAPIAASEWGSRKDDSRGSAPRKRALRGRKFYWRTKASNGREGRRPHHSENVAGRRWVWAEGTIFDGEITFENISLAELGSILTALAPGLLLSQGAPEGDLDASFVLPLGGAKPLGFGSAGVDITHVDVWTGNRYVAPEQVTEVAPSEAVKAFRDAVLATEVTADSRVFANPDLATHVWPAAQRLLSLDGLSGQEQARVWYPPGEVWSERERKPQEFDEGYAFWNASKGFKTKRMLPLPHATDPDQQMPIKGEGHR